MTDTESTSAALRRVEQERDEALGKARAAEADRREMYEALFSAVWQRDLARAELASARTELDAVRTARDNLDRARSWIVARDGGRACIRCDQEIRRGEAYELMPGVDALQHIHCRTEEPQTDE